jgi:multidrug efflux system outer membrane protein
MKRTEMKKITLITSMALSAALSGCTMAPKYERPDVAVQMSASSGDLKSAADIGWRDYFQDQQLQHVIQLALEHNADMQTAVLNVQLLQAQYRIQKADLLPSIDATGSGSRSRTAKDLTSTGKAVTSSTYSAGVGVTSWELDLFGRVRSLKEEALQNYFASEATKDSVKISLIAEVATQYLTRISLTEQLAISRQSLESSEKSLQLTQRMHELGEGSLMDVKSAEAEVAQVKASVSAYTRQLAQADNALELLIGQSLPETYFSVSDSLDHIEKSLKVKPGISSDFLRTRPDIVAAEHALQAANADIGAARAAFFPQITLTGSVGTSSNELDGLFKSGNGTWNFAPQISVPIFHWGSNKASLDVSKIEKQIEVVNYENAIRTAFREVKDTLVASEPLQTEFESYTDAADAQKKRYELAQTRYEKGLDSYLTLITAQQDYYSAKLNKVTAQLSLLSNQITFYKVLGGGVSESSH